MKNEIEPTAAYLRIGLSDLPTEETDIRKKAEILIALDQSVKTTQQKMSSLKQELLNIVKERPLEVGEQMIVYVGGSEGLVLNRDAIKKALMEKFHTSELAVESFLASVSSKKIMNPYVKVISKAAVSRMANTLNKKSIEV